MDFANLTTHSLLMLHSAVHGALAEDDKVEPAERLFRVRETGDWRAWADALETELERRNAPFHRIDWDLWKTRTMSGIGPRDGIQLSPSDMDWRIQILPTSFSGRTWLREQAAYRAWIKKVAAVNRGKLIDTVLIETAADESLIVRHDRPAFDPKDFFRRAFENLALKWGT
jgi:hypothetical protein